MENKQPATPPQNGATPGQDANEIKTPSTPGLVVPEGKVLIDTKEFAQLQRDAARAKSAQKRDEINRKKAPTTENIDDPDAALAIQTANDRAEAAERRAMQLEVRDGVREILGREEFKNVPKSTKDLILRNPSALSKASNLEEALLDIEDYLRDNIVGVDTVTTPPADGGQPKPGEKKVETPPNINSGAPAPADAAGFEDVSKLSGTAKSQAMIRNKIREAQGVKKV